jgi:hypothetical protein
VPAAPRKASPVADGPTPHAPSPQRSPVHTFARTINGAKKILAELFNEPTSLATPTPPRPNEKETKKKKRTDCQSHGGHELRLRVRGGSARVLPVRRLHLRPFPRLGQQPPRSAALQGRHRQMFQHVAQRVPGRAGAGAAQAANRARVRRGKPASLSLSLSLSLTLSLSLSLALLPFLRRRRESMHGRWMPDLFGLHSALCDAL